MKRFVKEYAQDIEKEIARRYAIIDNPKKLSAYSRKANDEASEKLKKIMFYAESELILANEAMRELAAIDPRNL